MAPILDHIRQMTHRRTSYIGECSHPKVAPTVITLNPRGDMLLLVGRQKCTIKACNDLEENRRHYDNAICFHVDSVILAGASPAFGFVLYSPGAAAAKRDHVKWNVNLPDDDPHAMLTIVNILYDRYNPTPRQPIDIEELANITILADKYELVHLLSKWAPQWIMDMEPYWEGRNFVRRSTEDIEMLLWISWVLGSEPLYAYMILQIAFHSGLDAAGRLTDPTAQLCFTDDLREVPVPPYVPAEIGHARIEILRIIRKEIKVTLEEHLHGAENEGYMCCTRLDGQEDVSWRRSVLRGFVEALEAEEIWPLPSAYDMTMSPKNLVGFFRLNPNLPAFTHKGLNGRFCETDGTLWERTAQVLRNIRFYVPAATAHRLSKQAIKSGLDKYYGSMGLKLDKGSWSIKEVMEFHIAAVTKRLTALGKGNVKGGRAEDQKNKSRTDKNEKNTNVKTKAEKDKHEKSEAQKKNDEKDKSKKDKSEEAENTKREKVTN